MDHPTASRWNGSILDLGVGCVLRVWWRRRRLPKAAKAALTGGRHQKMRARLWWSPCPEGGAAAWVSLYADKLDSRPVVSERVVGLPTSLELLGDGTVEVIGRPVEGGVVVVRAADRRYVLLDRQSVGFGLARAVRRGRRPSSFQEPGPRGRSWPAHGAPTPISTRCTSAPAMTSSETQAGSRTQ